MRCPGWLSGHVQGILWLGVLTAGCSWSSPAVPPPVPLDERPRVAVLTVTLGVSITSLSTIQTVHDSLSPEEEQAVLAKALQGVKDHARSLLFDRLTQSGQIAMVPLEETDAALLRLGKGEDDELTLVERASLRRLLRAELLIGVIVQDFGKVRWQWLAAGMLGDMTWESIALGLATGRHPGGSSATLDLNS